MHRSAFCMLAPNIFSSNHSRVVWDTQPLRNVAVGLFSAMIFTSDYLHSFLVQYKSVLGDMGPERLRSVLQTIPLLRVRYLMS